MSNLERLDELLRERVRTDEPPEHERPLNPLPARSPRLGDGDLERLAEEVRAHRASQTVMVRAEPLSPSLLDRSLRSLITGGLQRAARFVQNVGNPDVGFAGAATLDDGSLEDVVHATAPCAVTLTTREDTPQHVTLLGETDEGELCVLGGAITTQGLPARLEITPQTRGDHLFVLITTDRSIDDLLALDAAEVDPCSVTVLRVIHPGEADA